MVSSVLFPKHQAPKHKAVHADGMLSVRVYISSPSAPAASSFAFERESQVIPTVLAAMSELEQALGGMDLDESTGNDTGMEGLLDQEQDVPGPQDQDQALLANEEVLQLLPEVVPCVICRRTHEDNLE